MDFLKSEKSSNLSRGDFRYNSILLIWENMPAESRKKVEMELVCKYADYEVRVYYHP